MDNIPSPIAIETERALQQSGGPMEISGQNGRYVVMRLDVYDAMLGVSEDEEAQTLVSVRRGLADVTAGRTQDVDQAFLALESRYAS